MCQKNIKERTKMLEQIAHINAAEGFDPSAFAEEYADLENGEKRRKVPVAVMIAMFRMKYPEGKITVDAAETENGYCAKARVYPSYKSAENEFLAEATTTREPIENKKNISVIEWAQTAAIGVALRNAGFCLQFALDYEDLTDDGDTDTTSTPNSSDATPVTEGADESKADSEKSAHAEGKAEPKPVEKSWDELTLEEKYKRALKIDCPINKYKGKTLGDLVSIDQHALKWVAESCRDEYVKNAAIAIFEYAQAQQAA